MFGHRLQQARGEGGQRHPIGRQRVDPVCHGRHQGGEGAVAETGPHQFTDCDRVGSHLSGQVGVLPEPRQVLRGQCGECGILQRRGDPEHPLRHRPDAVGAPDVRLSGRPCHLQPQFLAQGSPDAATDRVGLRARVHPNPADLDAGDHALPSASRPRGPTRRDALPGETVAGQDAGEAAPDDDGGHRLCRSATRSVSTPGSVVGGTPCPRLTTCAGAARPRSTTSRAWASSAGQPAASSAGSMLPCSGSPGEQRGGLVEGGAVVDAHRLDAACGHVGEDVPGPGAEVDARDAALHRLQDRGRVGGDVPDVVGAGQRTCPGVEQLDRARPGIHLDAQELPRQVRAPGEQPMPGARIRVHHRPRREVVAGAATLHQVGGQGERRAREADQRGGLPQLGHHQAHRLRDGGGLHERVPGDAVHVGGRAYGLVDHRAHARVDLHLYPREDQRRHDVREQDGGVHVVPPHRLQGDLGGQLGDEAGLEDGGPLADGAVLGQRPARLAHEPDGQSFGAVSAERGKHGIHLWTILPHQTRVIE